MSKNLKFITTTAIGIALYVVLSMTAKIPVIGHISLDLGYIVLAVYCYLFGGISGAIVGGAGCVLVSLVSSGWFPPGWMLGNILIGIICGAFYAMDNKTGNRSVFNVLLTVMAVVVGVAMIKTVVECILYGIPLAVKLPKNAVAAAMDALVMSIGAVFAPRLERFADR